MVKRVSVFLDTREEKLLTILLKKYGGSAQNLFRSFLKDKFDKAFPAYTIKTKGGQNPMLVDLTPEQFCEQVGGKIDQMARVCMFPPVATGMAASIGIPFGDPNDMLKRLNEFREQGGLDPLEI